MANSVVGSNNGPRTGEGEGMKRKGETAAGLRALASWVEAQPEGFDLRIGQMLLNAAEGDTRERQNAWLYNVEAAALVAAVMVANEGGGR